MQESSVGALEEGAGGPGGSGWGEPGEGTTGALEDDDRPDKDGGYSQDYEVDKGSDSRAQGEVEDDVSLPLDPGDPLASEADMDEDLSLLTDPDPETRPVWRRQSSVHTDGLEMEDWMKYWYTDTFLATVQQRYLESKAKDRVRRMREAFHRLANPPSKDVIEAART
eukprot:gene16445-20814_t